VLERRSERFQMEYPCHSPTENRWFLGNVTPLDEGQRGAVVSHMTITERKLLELQLVKIASTDPLTALPNRRYFEEVGDREVERVSRFATPASVVMIDLDYFKAVNDGYGHGGGDEALRCVARTCAPLLRQIDVIARIGGEEFAILLPGTTEAGAARAAEKLRRALSEAIVEYGAHRFRLTASFGVSALDPRDHDIKEALARADAALYAAKSAGRNCVMTANRVTAPRRRLLRAL
jgi:diguanylate cyclase (GGDEF)-like protein